jgi:hypothetical protein
LAVATSEQLPVDGQIWPKHVAEFNFNFNTLLSLGANKIELNKIMGVQRDTAILFC